MTEPDVPPTDEYLLGLVAQAHQELLDAKATVMRLTAELRRRTDARRRDLPDPPRG